MANVRIGACIIRDWIDLVLHYLRIVRAYDDRRLVRPVILSLRERVSGYELEAAREALRSLNSQTVIDGARGALEDADAVVGKPCSARDRARCWKAQERVGLAVRSDNRESGRRKQVYVARAR